MGCTRRAGSSAADGEIAEEPSRFTHTERQSRFSGLTLTLTHDGLTLTQTVVAF